MKNLVKALAWKIMLKAINEYPEEMLEIINDEKKRREAK